MSPPDEALLLDAAAAGDRSRLEALTAQHPRLAERSLHAAAALLDAGAVAAHLTVRPDAADEPGGPRALTPLMYACSTPAGPDAEARRLDVCRALLSAGADPNQAMQEMDSLRGHRSCLGAAVGRARSARLVELLLASGAEVADGPSLYEGGALWEAVRHDDAACAAALLSSDPPPWQVNHALPHALGAGAFGVAERLLAHGADPNWTKCTWAMGGTALHEAVAVGVDPAWIDRLVDAGASLDAVDRDGRTAHAVAVRLDRRAHAERLRARGAADTLTPVDRWLAACFAGDAAAAARLSSALAPADLDRGDHQMLARALRLGRADAARSLVTLLDPNRRDDNGQAPLHLAVGASADLVERLLSAGADPNLPDFDGRTPLTLARGVDGPQREAVVALLEQAGGVEAPAPDPAQVEAFEAAADAVAVGDVDTLRELLARYPALTTARSPRPHRATLFHYTGSNGVEAERQRTPANAVEVMQLLLDAGCDPNATCLTYRGGPDQTALGLMITSYHPQQAGLMLPLLRTLAAGGAELPEEVALLLEADALAPGADALPLERRVAASPAAAGLALVEAARQNAPALVSRLLALGAPVDFRARSGETALHGAAFAGHAEVVDVLLSRGADTTLRDHVHDGTPAGWAEAGGHRALAERLQR